MKERKYRIGEAAQLLELEGYVLRFWETEFPGLRPVRTPKGQRLYSEADLALLRRIRFLLHEQGMTIEGARRVLDGTPSGQDVSKESSSQTITLEQGKDARKTLRDALSRVESELLTLKHLLKNSD